MPQLHQPSWEDWLDLVFRQPAPAPLTELAADLSKRIVLDIAFGPPAAGSDEDGETDYTWWDEDQGPERVVAYLTRLFENSGDLPSRFTEDEIERGLYYLISPGESDTMFALMDESLPWESRERAIRGISRLYRDLFMPRCRVDERLRLDPSSKLNQVCYMWWDTCPLPGHSERLDRVVLDVQRETLELPSIACRQAALHGLGHIQHRFPAEVADIVDGFLRSNRDAPRDLLDYARCARCGSVL